MVYRTDLRLGEVVSLLIFYNSWNSQLLSLNGFEFIFWSKCDIENRNRTQANSLIERGKEKAPALFLFPWSKEHFILLLMMAESLAPRIIGKEGSSGTPSGGCVSWSMTSTFWHTLDTGNLEQEGSGLRALSSSCNSPLLPLSLLLCLDLLLRGPDVSITGNAFLFFLLDAGCFELLLQLVLEALSWDSTVTLQFVIVLIYYIINFQLLKVSFYIS